MMLRFGQKKLHLICDAIDEMVIKDWYGEEHVLSIDDDYTVGPKPLYKFHQNGMFIFDINRIEIRQEENWNMDESITLIVWERSHKIKEYRSFLLSKLQLEYINRSLSINSL